MSIFCFRSNQVDENKEKKPATKEKLPKGEVNLGGYPSEYFGHPRFKNKMTIVFHAVLAPHLKFEVECGDRLYVRFEGWTFGYFNDNVIEVHPLR